MSGKYIRAFIAVPLPPQVQNAAGALQGAMKKKVRGNITWVVPAHMHLTVKFLGNTDTSRLSAIATRMDSLARAHRTWDIAFRGAGAFPSFGRPRVLWMGVEDGNGTLKTIHRACEQSMGEIGFEKESREFHPHLTLGRVKSLKGPVSDSASFGTLCPSPVTMRVDRLVLFQSTLSGKGPSYTVIHTSFFGNAADNA